MKDVVKKDSVCATVLSSGDFALDSIFNGAREVITFDINENQLYSASLKLAAIQNVGYEDYYNFLANSCCDSFLSNDIYSFIKEKSNDESFVFEFFLSLLLFVFIPSNFLSSLFSFSLYSKLKFST